MGTVYVLIRERSIAPEGSHAHLDGYDVLGVFQSIAPEGSHAHLDGYDVLGVFQSDQQARAWVQAHRGWALASTMSGGYQRKDWTQIEPRGERYVILERDYTGSSE